MRPLVFFSFTGSHYGAIRPDRLHWDIHVQVHDRPKGRMPMSRIEMLKPMFQICLIFLLVLCKMKNAN